MRLALLSTVQLCAGILLFTSILTNKQLHAKWKDMVLLQRLVIKKQNHNTCLFVRGTHIKKHWFATKLILLLEECTCMILEQIFWHFYQSNNQLTQKNDWQVSFLQNNILRQQIFFNTKGSRFHDIKYYKICPNTNIW